MLRRFLCFACVFLGGFFASACVETVPWADPVQCEEAGCTAANRECTALNRFEVVCGKCIDDFEQCGGECLPMEVLLRCDDLVCREQHRSCDAQANTDAQCGACVDGYVEENATCRPRTPCEQNADICGEGNCVDAEDNYLCECFEGFEFDGTACVDVNECEADAEVCGDNAACTNTLGSYECACIAGFEFDDSATCVDIDECEAIADACGPNEACTNTSGSYECACIEGFEFDGTACVDIDECEADPEVCGDNATCTNTIGSYECACIEGFEFDGTACVDVRPCSVHDDLCAELEICAHTTDNTEGYTCECMEGLLPTAIGCQPRVLNIAVGTGYSCAIVENGDLYCWGSSSYGALGIGDESSHNAPPTLVEGNHRWRTVEVSTTRTCGITTDNDLYCWGRSIGGRLGTGHNGENITTPHPVHGGHKWLQFALGDEHGCGITDNLKMYCWGWNGYGQAGDEIPPSAPERFLTPTLVQADLRWSEVKASAYHTVGYTDTGVLYAWGKNENNHLGAEDYPVGFGTPPSIIAEGFSWSTLEAGDTSTCGISGGELYCWGRGEHGQLGLGPQTIANEPTRVGNENGWIQLSTYYSTSCALKGGDAYCWGPVSYGVSSSEILTTPAPINSEHQWSHIAAGNGYICGVSDGIAHCWGRRTNGQLGHNEITDLLTPRPVQFFP